MITHVRLREFNTYGEEAGCKNDAHDLEGDAVRGGAPRARIKDICDMRSDENAK